MFVDYSTYETFILTTDGDTIGLGECWDYINLIWDHLGSKYWTYPPSDPSATNHGVKWGWINIDARNANTIAGLTQIIDKTNIKKGDIVIISDGEYGHGAFANEDYNGTDTLSVYSQNYNGVRWVRNHNMSLANFLGAWRYESWQPIPPTPPTPTGGARGRFPFVLYARKLRNQ